MSNTSTTESLAQRAARTIQQDNDAIQQSMESDFRVEQARIDERERCAKSLEMTNADILLMAGEMDAETLRTVQAILKGKASAFRRGDFKRVPKSS